MHKNKQSHERKLIFNENFISENVNLLLTKNRKVYEVSKTCNLQKLMKFIYCITKKNAPSYKEGA